MPGDTTLKIKFLRVLYISKFCYIFAPKFNDLVMDDFYERFELFTDFEGNVYGGSAHIYERTLYVYFDLVIGDICADIRSNDFLIEMFFKYIQSEKGVNIFKQDYNAVEFSYNYIVDEKLD